MGPRGKRQESREKKRGRIGQILTIVFAAVFVVAAIGLGVTLFRAHQEQSAFTNLTELVTETETPASSSSAAPVRNYQALYDANPNFVGWISISDTKIDYPVMSTPDDPEYYLHRAFDGSSSSSGVPFFGENCTVDTNNIIIYGHNMKNGTMFGGLTKFEDSAYGQAHAVLEFDTLAENAQYEIIAVFHSKVYDQDDEGVFRYYDYGGELDEERFNEYVTQVKAAALYDTGVTASYGDKLITLSTCGYFVKDGRIVVVAKKIVGEN